MSKYVDFLKVIAGIILVSIFVGISFLIINKVNKRVEVNYKKFDSLNSDKDDINSYNNVEIVGSDVLEAIKELQTKTKVTTVTTLGITQYPNDSLLVVNDKGSTSYLNPDAIFVGTIITTGNAVATGVTFTEKAITLGEASAGSGVVDSLSGEDAKQIIVDAIENGAATTMSWEDIAGIITSTFTSLGITFQNSGDYKKELENQLTNLQQQYLDIVNANGASSALSLTEEETKSLILTALEDTVSGFNSWEDISGKIVDLNTSVTNLKTNIVMLTEQSENTSNVAMKASLVSTLTALTEQLQAKADLANLLTQTLASSTSNTITNQDKIDNLSEDLANYLIIVATTQASVDKLNNDIAFATELLNTTKVEEQQWHLSYDQEYARFQQYLTNYNNYTGLNNNLVTQLNSAKTKIEIILGDAKNTSYTIEQSIAKLQTGKTAMVNAIGLPTASSESLSQMATDINSGNNLIKSALSEKGITWNGTDMNTLISSINSITGSIEFGADGVWRGSDMVIGRLAKGKNVGSQAWCWFQWKYSSDTYWGGTRYCTQLPFKPSNVVMLSEKNLSVYRFVSSEWGSYSTYDTYDGFNIDLSFSGGSGSEPLYLNENQYQALNLRVIDLKEQAEASSQELSFNGYTVEDSYFNDSNRYYLEWVPPIQNESGYSSFSYSPMDDSFSQYPLIWIAYK